MQNHKKHLLLELSVADYITSLAIVLVLSGFWLLWNGHTELAIGVVFVSMFLDYLDGRIARAYGGSPYGKVLDSLYDILGWVLFVALTINIQTGWAWWSLIITTAFGLAAALRLARFTVGGYVEKADRYYTGMPVSYSRYALLVVLLAGGSLSALMIAVMIPLMVSSRLFKKSPPLLMQINLVYAAIFIYLAVMHARS
jgi:phosphatidylserine synthase